MYFQGQFDELYKLTKANLETIEAKAWYLLVFVHVEGIWNDPSFLDKILEFEQEFEDNKEDYPLEYGMYLTRLGRGYVAIGDIPKAIDIQAKGLSYLKKYDKELYAGFLVNLGGAYRAKGEFDRALQIMKKGLEISEQENNLQLQGFICVNIGMGYFSLGDIDKSLEYMLEGRKRIKKSLNIHYYRIALGQICRTMLLSGKRSEVSLYLKELEELWEEFPHPLNLVHSKLMKALHLKTSHRLRHKIDAERIYRDLLSDTPPDQLNAPIHLEAIKHLCELLLMELKTYGEREVFEEIQYYIDMLFDRSKKLYYYPFLVEAYILKSRLLLIDGEFDKAGEILQEGLGLMKEKNLPRLEKAIKNEMKKLEGEFLNHQSILQTNTSFSKKIEKLQIQEYLRFAMGYKGEYENKK